MTSQSDHLQVKDESGRLRTTFTENRDTPKVPRERRVVGKPEKKPTAQKAISVCASKFKASIIDLSGHSQRRERERERPSTFYTLTKKIIIIEELQKLFPAND